MCDVTGCHVIVCDVTGCDVTVHDIIGCDVTGCDVTVHDVTGCDVTGLGVSCHLAGLTLSLTMSLIVMTSPTEHWGVDRAITLRGEAGRQLITVCR